MLPFVEHPSSQTVPNAEECDEVDEVSLSWEAGEWCYNAAGECAKAQGVCDWPGQSSQPSPSSL